MSSPSVTRLGNVGTSMLKCSQSVHSCSFSSLSSLKLTLYSSILRTISAGSPCGAPLGLSSVQRAASASILPLNSLTRRSIWPLSWFFCSSRWPSCCWSLVKKLSHSFSKPLMSTTAAAPETPPTWRSSLFLSSILRRSSETSVTPFMRFLAPARALPISSTLVAVLSSISLPSATNCSTCAFSASPLRRSVLTRVSCSLRIRSSMAFFVGWIDTL
mmetsp:Transcript_18339/g.62372  ORF Transcript_18339/g.62372 Transcript_18339/m.62372 type:complete len:216 (-) Transcript_18339:2141-2788(-)